MDKVKFDHVHRYALNYVLWNSTSVCTLKSLAENLASKVCRRVLADYYETPVQIQTIAPC